MREGFILTRREASELFILLSNARLKLKDKWQTSAQKWFEKFEEAMGLSTKQRGGEE